MKVAEGWKDYEVIATGGGEKLERWGKVYLLRPDPQVIWKSAFDFGGYSKLSARYIPEGKLGEKWELYKSVPDTFTISRGKLTFNLKLMKGFKHTGLFPEQAVNWDAMSELIKKANRPINVLNLFAYTGGATMACAQAGASVCHVDAATSMVQRAKDNMTASGLADKPVRYIIDDCVKFVKREIKRGKKYDAIIMDPPSFGRGPTGELWKIENDLDGLIGLTTEIMSDTPLFYLVNSYTTGLQPGVIGNLIDLNFKGVKHVTDAYEVGLPTDEGIVLPCGCSGLARF